MDIYDCIPFPCVCVPSMCTYAKPKGNGRERGPSWLTSKIKCQNRKEYLKFKFCLGQIRVSKDWAIRVQWACLGMFYVCSPAIGRSVHGGFPFFRLELTALIKHTAIDFAPKRTNTMTKVGGACTQWALAAYCIRATKIDFYNSSTFWSMGVGRHDINRYVWQLRPSWQIRIYSHHPNYSVPQSEHRAWWLAQASGKSQKHCCDISEITKRRGRERGHSRHWPGSWAWLLGVQ